QGTPCRRIEAERVQRPLVEGEQAGEVEAGSRDALRLARETVGSQPFLDLCHPASAIPWRFSPLARRQDGGAGGKDRRRKGGTPFVPPPLRIGPACAPRAGRRGCTGAGRRPGSAARAEKWRMRTPWTRRTRTA